MSPRRKILRKPARRQSADRLVDLTAAPSCEGRLPGRLTRHEHLAGVGQGDDQRVIAPGAVVGDVHALLAAAAGGDQGAVHVDDGLVEEGGGLLRPDLEPGLVDDVLQGLDVGRR